MADRASPVHWSGETVDKTRLCTGGAQARMQGPRTCVEPGTVDVSSLCRRAARGGRSGAVWLSCPFHVKRPARGCTGRPDRSGEPGARVGGTINRCRVVAPDGVCRVAGSGRGVPGGGFRAGRADGGSGGAVSCDRGFCCDIACGEPRDSWFHVKRPRVRPGHQTVLTTSRSRKPSSAFVDWWCGWDGDAARDKCAVSRETQPRG